MKPVDPPMSNAARPFGLVDRTFRKLFVGRLGKLQRGTIALHDEGQRGSVTRLGAGTDDDALQASVTVHRPRFYREAVLGGSLSVAESYLQGDWDCDDLTSLFRIFIRNMDAADRMDRGVARVVSSAHRLVHRLRANTPAGSRRNIEAHYDLGNDFFRLWLDETWAYSSGMFVTPDATLAEASLEKFDRVCRKLELGPDDEVLEIGSGWGGFALHAVGRYGARVTTTTISQQQFDVARRRLEEAGYGDRATVLLRDYRELTGRFDKIVSIEMIEAVGRRYFDDYFRQCGRLLEPDGSLVLQAIVMPERRYAGYLKSVDFIQRYVFPGGCLPSVGAMLESVGRSSDLRFVHAEDFAPHYAETLRRWRQAFDSRRNEVRRLGYSERFLRLWHYYLCYCEALFEERYVGVVQIQFDKPLCRRDPLRVSEAAAAPRTPIHREARRTVVSDASTAASS